MEKYYGINSKFYSENKMKRTGIAGIFAASLNYKRGVIQVSKKNFDKLMIKKLKMKNKKNNIIDFPASPTKN